MRHELFEKFGVDLTAVEGVSIQTVLTFLGEVGTNVGKFPSADHFASGLGLCPDNRITGGRTHAAHTRKVNNRLATALRITAQSLHPSKAGLGDWFRRLKSKLGTKAAVTAAAPTTPIASAIQSWSAPRKNAFFDVRPSNSASP